MYCWTDQHATAYKGKPFIEVAEYPTKVDSLFSFNPLGSSTPPPPGRSGVGEPMFNFNGGARADLMAAVEELERHNDQERDIDL